MRRWLAIAITLAIKSFPCEAVLFNPQATKLDNGLEVILVENHMAPVVSLSVIYKVGTADDPCNMVGLSHFLEHLMFKGTKNTPIGEFKKKIISHGGIINAYTSHDVTAYTSDVPVDILDMVLELEADRMANLIFDENETLAEQKVVIEERRMRLENHPLGGSHETVLRGLFKYHPYGIPPIGYPHHIAAYTKEAAKAHYEKWYTPNNAIIIISGDITMEKLLPMVKKYFGTIPSRPVPKRHRPEEPVNTEIISHFKIRSKRISSTSHDWYFKAPNYKYEPKKFYFPLNILEHVLGGSSISRLYKDLVTKRNLAIGVECDYEGKSIDPRHFTLSAILHPNATLEDLKEAVEQHIKDVAEKGITEQELNEAKRDILSQLAFMKDGNANAISILSNYAHDMSLEQIENSPERIKSVTLQEVNDVAKEILGAPPVLTTTVRPDENQAPGKSTNKQKSRP